MNRLGMIIDVSHISNTSFYDVLEISGDPVIASHSCARAICDNPRNLTDGMLKKLADCKDVSEMKNITAELFNRGYTEEDIHKIWGGNLMRVFRRSE